MIDVLYICMVTRCFIRSANIFGEHGGVNEILSDFFGTHTYVGGMRGEPNENK